MSWVRIPSLTPNEPAGQGPWVLPALGSAASVSNFGVGLALAEKEVRVHLARHILGGGEPARGGVGTAGKGLRLHRHRRRAEAMRRVTETDPADLDAGLRLYL
jgi:hypothetical protein